MGRDFSGWSTLYALAEQCNKAAALSLKRPMPFSAVQSLRTPTRPRRLKYCSPASDALLTDVMLTANQVHIIDHIADYAGVIRNYAQYLPDD